MRTPRSVATLLLVVAALVIGSVGISTAAAPVTKAVVKKLAKGVVKKQAPKLSVANADKLDGLDSSALQTRAYRFSVPSEATATPQTYTFPGLPAGKYLASYSISTANTATGATLTCAFIDTAEGGSAAASYSGGYDSNTRVNASAVITTTASTNLLCAMAGGTFSVDASASSISFVPIDSVVAGAASS